MYNDHYGLTGRPFQLTPDPRFYFESATHKKAMAYLGYGLAQGEGFIVITGEIGSGKTTLTGHLLGTIDPLRIRAIRIVSTSFGGDDLLRLVAAQVGVATESLEKAEVLDRIETNLLDHARTGQKTLIIVDEVQNLEQDALEELRMLSNFQAGDLENICSKPKCAKTHLQQCSISKIFPGEEPPDPRSKGGPRLTWPGAWPRLTWP